MGSQAGNDPVFWSRQERSDINAERIKATLVNFALSALVAVLSLTAPVGAQTDSLPIQAIRDRVALL